MTTLKKGTVNIAQVVYVDPVTGEMHDSPTTDSLQAKSFFTTNWEMTDGIVGAYRGTALSVVNDQPLTAQEGDRVLVGTAPTGTFSSWTNQIVGYTRNYSNNTLAWVTEGTPLEGTLLYLKTPGTYVSYQSGSWVSAFGGNSARTAGPVVPNYVEIYAADSGGNSFSLYPTTTIIEDSFVAPQDGPLGKVRVFGLVSASVSGSASLQCQIYADNSGNPASLITTSDNKILLSSLATTGYQPLDFTFSTMTMVNGTTYWVEVGYSDTQGVSSSAYAQIEYFLTSVGATGFVIGSSGATPTRLGGDLTLEVFTTSGTTTGTSPTAGTPIVANSQGFIDQSFLQYAIDFGTNKPRLNPTYTSADTYVIANKGYVDTLLAAYQPGVIYSCTSSVSQPGMLVSVSSSQTVSPLDITTSTEAVGVTLTPNTLTSQVTVLANDNEISVPAGMLVNTGTAYAAGQRLYWAQGWQLSNLPPTGHGQRVWQVGILSDATSGAMKMHVQVVFKKVIA